MCTDGAVISNLRGGDDGGSRAAAEQTDETIPDSDGHPEDAQCRKEVRCDGHRKVIEEHGIQSTRASPYIR